MKKKDKSSTNKISNNVTVGTLADAQKPDMQKWETGRGALGKGSPKDRYVYCDFAQIKEEEYDVDYEIDQEGLLQALDESTTMAAAQSAQHQSISYLQQPPPVLRASGWVRSQRFPTKLYALLSQPQLSNIITWMPHGRSWKVLETRIFETSVLPVFFESDNYHSFNRVINAWSFRRKSSGPDRGSYFHELFLRGKPHLQKYMRRLPRTHKKLAMSKSEEPDFFELEKTSPLPTLDQARASLESRKYLRLRDHFDKETVVQGGMADHSRSQLPAPPLDKNGNDQAKRQGSEQHDAAALQCRTMLATKGAPPKGTGTLNNVDQFTLGVQHNVNARNGLKVPESLFRLNHQDKQLKDQLELQSRITGQHQQVTIRQQQEQQMIARHHRAQILHQFEQEQYLRAQSVHKAELTQQQSQMNLLRQMDLLQQQHHQRNGF
ncbi:unnamed protein product [Pseudo-nitzschia multistriata]|uniref:HSF-type DNA-binding domain-containing protein n=1 Tax=Pseudo-nitzschia multistriata TaxID=183589 RepID=A0A448Z3X9_9STRA|nr:unnamed protein product [Pseudo-nitzschia multistriata]